MESSLRGSKDPMTRVRAMGELVQPWIKRKLLTMKMEDGEKKALMDRLMKLVAEGRRLFGELTTSKDPDYVDWSFYGSCQACEAVKTVSKMLDKKKK